MLKKIIVAYIQKNPRILFAVLCVFLWLITSSCTDLQKPKLEEFYGAVKPPTKQEFRWSNGKLPKQLDPALASAPPETDLVRAVYEGLTDLDAKTLEARPSIAERWEISDDGRTWTFHLRKDAKWTNGEPVTAKDFVRSWRRLAEMGAAVPHSKLLKNIVGAENFAAADGISVLPDEEFETTHSEDGTVPVPPEQESNSDKTTPQVKETPTVSDQPAPPADPQTNVPAKAQPKRTTVNKWLGVEAVNDTSLRVWLIQPDRNFPVVVAHPLFRPVYKDEANLLALENAPKAVTNGAFTVTSVTKEELVLTRSESFWGREGVGLESVRMIAKSDSESALAAYQANEVDAITNTHLEPLALKLLMPYQDFRRTTHNALTFYQFNFKSVPFDDPRVRQALAMGVERERIVQDEMDGAAEPALDFLPFVENEKGKIKEHVFEAKRLLAEAGYEDISTFPKVRLLINRNDLQRRIANAVAKMWQKNLGIQTEVIVKDRAEYEEALKNGDYDLVRRGVVLPTVNETSSMLAMFDEMPDKMGFIIRLLEKENKYWQEKRLRETVPETPLQPHETPLPQRDTEEVSQKNNIEINGIPAPGDGGTAIGKAEGTEIILTEKTALAKMPGIPLYFPVSNALVKPYVSGFETNLLDAPSLKTVHIDAAWKNSLPQK